MQLLTHVEKRSSVTAQPTKVPVSCALVVLYILYLSRIVPRNTLRAAHHGTTLYRTCLSLWHPVAEAATSTLL